MIPKFRAWHKEAKKMHQIGQIIWSSADEIQSVEPLTHYDLFFPREIELMQWTGFQDKNGIDIYEGDIVKTEWGDYVSGAYIDTLGSFYHSHTEFSWDAEHMEVLGNIYENPELIESPTAR